VEPSVIDDKAGERLVKLLADPDRAQRVESIGEGMREAESTDEMQPYLADSVSYRILPFVGTVINHFLTRKTLPGKVICRLRPRGPIT
jgi:hypothetical protein